ncbi:hemin uptake protein HemP [Daeguia caeni]|uniref:Hemin uptake protein HemP n=1 Tax=Daeguia caeni TaxID=439612 RepID=A0ABV9H5Y0_9HYPH
MNRRIHIDMQVRLPRDKNERGADGQSSSSAGTHVGPQSVQGNFQLKTYGTRELFGSAREVGIEHGGALYRLKITRQGKLILNK